MFPLTHGRRVRAQHGVTRAAHPRSGFSLIEMMIAMVVGVVVVTAATGVAINAMRSTRATEMREGLTRTGRFLGMAFERDLLETGVDIESSASFGSIAVRNDTLTILSVPYDPDAPPQYQLLWSSPLPPVLPGGNCLPVTRCAVFKKDGTNPVALEPGDLALLTIQSSRRLVVVSNVAAVTGGARVTFVPNDSVLWRPANFTGDLLLYPPATTLQRIRVVTYWREGTTLYRSSRHDADGELIREVVADNVQDFQVSLIFVDDTERLAADPTDALNTNDYNRIKTVRVRVTARTEEAWMSGSGRPPADRLFEWHFTPRNLKYERNRDVTITS